MRKNLVKIFIFSLLFFVQFAFAQEKLNLTITPPLIKVNFNPGQVWSSSIKVINNNPNDLNIFIEVMDFKSGPEGGVIFIKDKTKENKKFFLSEWIEFPKEPILIPAFQSKNIPFTIVVPQDAEPGGKYAAILVGVKPPQEIGGTAIKVTPLVSSLILANVRGNVIESIWIREFSTNKIFYQKPKVEFVLKIENIGNVHVQPQGEIQIFNLYGKERGKISFNQQTEYGNVLPQSSRKWNFTWESQESLFEIGRYKALLTLNYGNELKQTEQRTIYFWIVPLIPLAGVLGSILIFFAIVFLSVRIYVKRIVALSLLKAKENISPQLEKEEIKVPLLIDKEGKKVLDIVRVKEREEKAEKPKIFPFFRKKFLALIILIFIIFGTTIYLREALKEKREYKVTISQKEQTLSEKVASEIEKNLIEKKEFFPKEEIDKKSFSISVLNGKGIRGLASEVASKLEKEGFKIERIGNADRFDYKETLIKYKKEKESEAKFLNEFFGGKFKLVEVENQKEDLILIIGQDFNL